MGLPSLVIPGTEKGGRVSFTILSEGKALPMTVGIASIVVKKEANRIPYARIVLFDGQPANATAKPNFELSSGDLFTPGKEIKIQVGYNSDDTTIFKGVVIKQSVRHRKSKAPMLEVEMKDEAVKLTIGRKNKIFSNKLDSMIISTVLGGTAGLVEPTTSMHKQVVQYFSTDWDFVLTRADINSRVVLVEDRKVSVRKPSLIAPPKLILEYGRNVMEFDAEMDARTQVKNVKAQAWDGAKNEVVSDTGKPLPVPLAQGNLTTSELAKVIDLDEYIIQHGGNLSKSELHAAAEAKALKSVFSKIRGSVKIEGTSAVKPGDVVTFRGIGTRFSGNAYVSGVMHDVSRGLWTTTLQFGLSFDWYSENNQLSDIPAASMIPAVNGLMVGKVAAFAQDPESNERIKVTIPVVDGSETIWARLATFEGGAERGAVYRPYEGDEVVIGFLNDDPRDPIILGSLYSKTNKPFLPADSKNAKKGYSTKNKLMLTFDDDKKVIQIETPGGNKITISDDKKGITIEDQNKNVITTSDSGISMESDKDIKITAKGDVSVEGKNIKLKAQTAFSADGQSEAKINSGSQTVIKGSIVKIN